MKKLLGIGSGMALVAAMALPVFASPMPMMGTMNYADVDTITVAVSNSGLNKQVNDVTMVKAGGCKVDLSGVNTMVTGDALAIAEANVSANTNKTKGMVMGSTMNYAQVLTPTIALSNSGLNSQENDITLVKAHAYKADLSGENTMITGGSQSQASSWVVVNQNVTWNSMHH